MVLSDSQGPQVRLSLLPCLIPTPLNMELGRAHLDWINGIGSRNALPLQFFSHYGGGIFLAHTHREVMPWTFLLGPFMVDWGERPLDCQRPLDCHLWYLSHFLLGKINGATVGAFPACIKPILTPAFACSVCSSVVSKKKQTNQAVSVSLFAFFAYVC